MRAPQLSWRENYLRAARFQRPEYAPSAISVFWPLWNTYRERLERVAAQYPLLFRGFRPGGMRYEGEPGLIYTDEYRRDAFGCLWRFRIKGYVGQVVEHPLSDWSGLGSFELPDPDVGVPTECGDPPIVPWESIFESMERAREEGELVVAWLPHGFFFQRLYYLRGFRNMLSDLVRREPRLYELAEKLAEYHLELVDRYLEFSGIDVFSFGDDLGTQTGMPVSPGAFRELVFPAYKRIFGRAKSGGALVRLHTDGRVAEVFDQLLEAGVDVLNVQDRVNGLDKIEEVLKGRVCVDLDIDRQRLIPYGTPGEIKAYVRRVVERLCMGEGGLMLYAEVHPPTPLENIEALAEAMYECMWLEGR